MAWVFAALAPVHPVIEARGQAALVDGSFDWLRKANGASDRSARRGLAELTRRAAQSGGYRLGSELIELRHVEAMLRGTRLCRGEVQGRVVSTKASLQVEKGTVLEVAVKQARQGATWTLLSRGGSIRFFCAKFLYVMLQYALNICI